MLQSGFYVQTSMRNPSFPVFCLRLQCGNPAFHERSRRLYSAFELAFPYQFGFFLRIEFFSFLRCSLAVLASFNCALAVASMFSAD